MHPPRDEAKTGRSGWAPLAPACLGYFENPTFSAANAGSGVMNLGTLGALFAFSIYLQQQEGESPIDAGLHILPWTAGLAVFAILGGRIAQRFGPRLPAGLGLG